MYFYADGAGAIWLQCANQLMPGECGGRVSLSDDFVEGFLTAITLMGPKMGPNGVRLRVGTWGAEDRSGRRRLGLLTALGAYAVIGAGAYIGGELSLGQLLGAKHTAKPIVPPADFTPVLEAGALSKTTPARADFNGVPILVSGTPSGGVVAISAISTHRGGPLAEGTFAHGCVTCPWHGSTFALDDRRIINGPVSFPQPRFKSRIRGDRGDFRALRSHPAKATFEDPFAVATIRRGSEQRRRTGRKFVRKSCQPVAQPPC
jgi:nitrite reductase/ring-hydroxylating ferredoxin subunit